MSGLLAGCHAIVFDGSRVMNLDGFAAVPSGKVSSPSFRFRSGTSPSCTRSARRRAPCPGFRLRSGSSGSDSGGFPGRGCASRRSSSRAAVFRSRRCTPGRSRCSASCTRSNRRPPPCSRAMAVSSVRARSCTSPVLRRPSKRSPRRARTACIADPLPRRCSQVDGLVISADDLARPPALARSGRRRGSTVDVLRPAEASRASQSSSRASLRVAGLYCDRAGADARQRVFEPVPAGGEHTTNMVAVDAHGRACVLTHSLGVGAGRWLPGFDTQLEQLARRVRHRARRASAGRSPREPDGTDARVRRGRARARHRLRRSDAPANRVGHRSRRRPRRGSRRRDRRVAAARPPHARPRRRGAGSGRGCARGCSKTLVASVRRWDRLHHDFGGVSCVGSSGSG